MWLIYAQILDHMNTYQTVMTYKHYDYYLFLEIEDGVCQSLHMIPTQIATPEKQGFICSLYMFHYCRQPLLFIILS